MSKPTAASLTESVRNAWCSILGVSAVNINDNFFELGGTSLQILQVKQRLDAELGQPIELIRFFQHPTVAELVTYLRNPGR